MNDEVAKTVLGRAYWVPVPLDFIRAAGIVTAQWGYFEKQFLGFIRILARRPELSETASKIPGSFDSKAKLLRQLARGAFPHCESLANKICDFSTRSNLTCKKRNIFVHGYWFDMTPFDPEMGVTIMTEPDGTGDFYSVTLTQLELLAEKILDLKIEGIGLMFSPGHSNLLTPDELNALQEHHKNFPGPSPEVQILRDPNRKGSPSRPEPFQA